jgi:predicted nucleotidyltransferase
VFSREDIRSKSYLVRDAVNFVLHDQGMSVDKIYLVGSYASNRQDDWSDIDYLVVLKGGKRSQTYPDWKTIQEINRVIDSKRIHCIYAVSLDAQKSLYQKDPTKYAYQEISNANTYRTSN